MAITTSDEAMALAFDWAEGRRSHWNEMLAVEASFESRPQTLAAVAQADAAEVVKWTSISSALAAREHLRNAEALAEHEAVV